MSSFDQWVSEAPSRHLGVFALVILAAVAMLTGCGVFPDYHDKCLKYEYQTVKFTNNYDDSERTTVTTTKNCVEYVRIWKN